MVVFRRCSLTALSINTALKRVPRIWGAASLPVDAFRLSAAPAGGALVLCQNLLLYHSQVRQTRATGSYDRRRCESAWLGGYLHLKDPAFCWR